MIIPRKNNFNIQKRKINFKNLDIYNEEKIKKATSLLKKRIDDSYASHFDYVTYFFEKEENKKASFTSYNKFTGCISECKKLKKELKKIGIKTYYVSCRANGFSNPSGDAYVKEAHVFLVYPSLKDNKLLFTILDPGFRLVEVPSFFDKENSSPVNYLDQGHVTIHYQPKNKNYPYEIHANKRIDYKKETADANIHWDFNPYYETINIDKYCEGLYNVYFSLKLMNYPIDRSNYLYIRSKIIEKKVDIYTVSYQNTFSFEELSKLSHNELENIFKPLFKKAKLSNKKLQNFIKSLCLLVNRSDEYVEKCIDKEVKKEYDLGYTLNR